MTSRSLIFTLALMITPLSMITCNAQDKICPSAAQLNYNYKNNTITPPDGWSLYTSAKPFKTAPTQWIEAGYNELEGTHHQIDCMYRIAKYHDPAWIIYKTKTTEKPSVINPWQNVQAPNPGPVCIDESKGGTRESCKFPV